MDNFTWLEQWYMAQCDGHWEHRFGVKIDSLDNPGWSVVIDLNGTRYSERQNFDIAERRSDGDDWIHCIIREGQFIGHEDPTKLGKIVQTFRKWIAED